MPNYIILHVNQIILNAGSRKQTKNLVKNRSPQDHFEGHDSLPLKNRCGYNLGYTLWAANSMFSARDNSIVAIVVLYLITVCWQLYHE